LNRDGRIALTESVPKRADPSKSDDGVVAPTAPSVSGRTRRSRSLRAWVQPDRGRRPLDPVGESAGDPPLLNHEARKFNPCVTKFLSKSGGRTR